MFTRLITPAICQLPWVHSSPACFPLTTKNCLCRNWSVSPAPCEITIMPVVTDGCRVHHNWIAYTRVRVRVSCGSITDTGSQVGAVYHSELSYVGATTSEEEEVPVEADRYLRGWKGKISGKEQHVRPSSFPSSTLVRSCSLL